ncbi:hypothetical protein VaNZ11_000439 [Volvox africanus]|uniref:Uncharacterized protein n=1 Tax=Volvox africanus TaxID=51714 RepID=A0ABQ5RND0_9CHLO|nr:hypothetical protein VaNZ11_000439 [Volvox africanus]
MQLAYIRRRRRTRPLDADRQRVHSPLRQGTPAGMLQTQARRQRKGTAHSSCLPVLVTNDNGHPVDVRPSTKVRRTSTGIKRKVPVEDKSTDGDHNNDSYDHQRKKVKSASEDVRCTRARLQRGSSGSKKKQELLEEEVSKDERSEDEQDDATSAREDDDNDDSEIEDD